jgi:hypothetical protein
MPKSDIEGLRSACARHKYAYIGTNFLRLQLSSGLTCKLVQLPGTSYPESLTYIISLNNPYKGLINWRWVGQKKLRTRLSMDSALLKEQWNGSLFGFVVKMLSSWHKILGSWDKRLGSGHKNLGSWYKFWVRGKKFWVCGTKFWVHGTKLWVRGTNFWVRITKFWVRGTTFWVSGTNVWVRGTEFWVHVTKFWVRSTKSNEHLSLKKTENLNSRKCRQVFPNIAMYVTPRATIRNSELFTVLNRHEECNIFGNSLMFLPCMLVVVETTNIMHWFYHSFILYTGSYMFRHLSAIIKEHLRFFWVAWNINRMCGISYRVFNLKKWTYFNINN